MSPRRASAARGRRSPHRRSRPAAGRRGRPPRCASPDRRRRRRSPPACARPTARSCDIRVASTAPPPTYMFWAIESSGISDPSWKTVFAPRRRERPGVAGVSDRPPISIEPLSAAIAPATILTSVDLPEPFSPTRAWISPGRSSIDTSCSALTTPKCLLTLRTLSAIAPVPSAASARRTALEPAVRTSSMPPSGRERSGRSPPGPVLVTSRSSGRRGSRGRSPCLGSRRADRPGTARGSPARTATGS